MSCDLHSHSWYSDGELRPADLVDAAVAAGLEVLALSDHDTIAGYPEAAERAAHVGLELLPAIEFSISEDEGRTQFHLLGYGFDVKSDELQICLSDLATARVDRARTCLELLAEQGVRLDLDALLAESAPGTVGRPHVARALVEAGACRTQEEAFTRYLRRGRPAYVPAPGLRAARALSLLHAAGGVGSLAHPFLSAGVDAAGGIEKFVGRWIVQGLDGIEIHHPRHKRNQRQRLSQLARRYGLLMTGGSDFHGAAKPDIKLGSVGIQRERYDALLERVHFTP